MAWRRMLAASKVWLQGNSLPWGRKYYFQIHSDIHIALLYKQAKSSPHPSWPNIWNSQSCPSLSQAPSLCLCMCVLPWRTHIYKLFDILYALHQLMLKLWGMPNEVKMCVHSTSELTSPRNHPSSRLSSMWVNKFLIVQASSDLGF